MKEPECVVVPETESVARASPPLNVLVEFVPVTVRNPAIVLVAVVDVALKLPKVGVEVAVRTPEALVESSELTGTPEKVTAPAMESVEAKEEAPATESDEPSCAAPTRLVKPEKVEVEFVPLTVRNPCKVLVPVVFPCKVEVAVVPM